MKAINWAGFKSEKVGCTWGGGIHIEVGVYVYCFSAFSQETLENCRHLKRRHVSTLL